MDEVVFSVSDFVAVFNQTISYAYPSVTIEGELDSFRISKGRWVYFNLKDARSSVKFFATVNQLPGPLEDGMLLSVKGVPFLHSLYGFSVNAHSIRPIGEGSIKQAAKLLEAKLAKEGLFDEDRKRPIDYPPKKIGLITSGNSAAYHDFIKILSERWGGILIKVADVQVQGEVAPSQISEALSYFNSQKELLDVIVIIRGGGSADDLAAFNSEIVTRAVATSRTPTLVAIGHEVDISLAEKAADKRGSTPTHAAEMLSPDRKRLLKDLTSQRLEFKRLVNVKLGEFTGSLEESRKAADDYIDAFLRDLLAKQTQNKHLMKALGPLSVLKRGYAMIKKKGGIVSSAKEFKSGDIFTVELRDGQILGEAKEIKLTLGKGSL